MKTITDHIKEVKKRPHHIRKQVAFASAGVLTAFIAIVWLSSSLVTGAFALKPTSFAESTGAVPPVSPGSTAGVAGAAAARNTAAPARIEIVDVASSTKVKAEPTTIPF